MHRPRQVSARANRVRIRSGARVETNEQLAIKREKISQPGLANEGLPLGSERRVAWLDYQLPANSLARGQFVGRAEPMSLVVATGPESEQQPAACCKRRPDTPRLARPPDPGARPRALMVSGTQRANWIIDYKQARAHGRPDGRQQLSPPNPLITLILPPRRARPDRHCKLAELVACR